MPLEFVTAIGLIAAALITAAFIPQVLKTWKTKKTEDISLVMFIAFNAGFSLAYLRVDDKQLACHNCKHRDIYSCSDYSGVQIEV